MIAELVVGTVVAWSGWQVLRHQPPTRRHHTVSRIPKR
jgi:hypothetical protein